MAAPASNSEHDRLSAEQAALVLEHLEHILASPGFAISKRAQDFLRLIVGHALAGQFDSLRERMIGVEMFGRRVDYDTANDAVVRVMASKIRHRLSQYYGSSDGVHEVRIELPVGSYVPQFCWTPVAAVADSEAVADSLPEGGLNDRDGAVRRSRSMAARFSLREWILLASGVVLLAAVVYFGIQQWRNSIASRQIRSIAILPLLNLSGDPSQDYFADGMTEELTAELGQVTSLRVISRTSTMPYKGTKKSLPEIARELNVDSIIEGSVEHEGNRIRITAQLIDSRTDRHLWAQTYDRDMSNVLELQSDVARQIADQIQIKLTAQEQARLARAQTIDPKAQDLYLKGMQFLNQGDPAKATGYFKEAIERYPNYAQAHAELADCYRWLVGDGAMPSSEGFALQKSEAVQAAKLDEALPQAHVELAYAAMNFNWDWKTQGSEFQRALELDPNSASTHWAYAGYLERTGQISEAIAECNFALQLDPASGRAYLNAAFLYYFSRQYDKALAQIRRAIELHIDPAETRFPLGTLYAEKGLYNEAIWQFQQLGNTRHAFGHLGNTYARQGNIVAARQMIAQLEDQRRKDNAGSYEIAQIYAGLGEKDKAFTWLENAYNVRDEGLTYIKIDPCLDPLRSDPRFQALLLRVGF